MTLDDRDVVVGVDGTTTCTPALERAVLEAGRTGSRVRVVRAWSLPDTADDDGKPLWHGAVGAVIEADTQGFVSAVLGSLPPTVDIDVECVEGPSGPVLVEASRQARMLVVGEPAGGAIRHDASSTVWYVLRYAQCTVIVIGDHATPLPGAADQVR